MWTQKQITDRRRLNSVIQWKRPLIHRLLLLDRFRIRPAGMVAAYQQKSVFWLAAKSLQMYLNEEIANFPPDTPEEISYEMIGNYLDDSAVWQKALPHFRKTPTERWYTSGFGQLDKGSELQPQTGKIITEENGFSSEQINAFITTFPKI